MQAVRKWLRWAPPRTLRQAFREDKLLTVAFVVLVLTALYPLFKTPLLPFVDWNRTVAHASYMDDVVRGQSPFVDSMRMKWASVPYWTVFILVTGFEAIGGVLFAAKAVVALTIIALPLSVMRLLITLGRDPRVGLWVFMFSYERNMWAGWVAYMLGLAIVFWTLACLLEADTWPRAIKTALLSALVALTHAQGLALLAVSGLFLFLTRWPTRRRTALFVVSLSGGLVSIAPWLQRLWANKGGEVTSERFTYTWHTLGERAEKAYSHTFDVFAGDFESVVPGLLFFFALAGPLLLTLSAKQRKAPAAAPLAIVLAGAFLYLALPFSFRAPSDVFHKHTYVRYLTVALIALLLVPRPRLRGRAALLLLPGVLLAVAMHVRVAAHFSHYGQRMNAMLHAAEPIEAGSKVLPLIYDKADPSCVMAPLDGLSTIVAADKDALALNGWGFRHLPVIYKRGARHIVKSRLVKEKDLRGYDYVFVQGRDPFEQPFGQHHKVKKVGQADVWTVYRVE